MYYTTEIDSQTLGYFCSVGCMNRHLAEAQGAGERVKAHNEDGDPELCDSLLCKRKDV